MTADQVREIARANVSGKEIAVAVIDALGEKYEGALKRASDTAEGAISTISDLWTEVVLVITSSGPWDDWVSFLTSARDTLAAGMDTKEFKAGIDALGGAISGITSIMGDFGKSAVRWLTEAAKLGGEIVNSEYWDLIKAAPTFGIGKEGIDPKSAITPYFDYLNKKAREQRKIEAGIAEDRKKFADAAENQGDITGDEIRAYNKALKDGGLFQPAATAAQEEEKKLEDDLKNRMEDYKMYMRTKRSNKFAYTPMP
jgi:hypothetical protein